MPVPHYELEFGTSQRVGFDSVGEEGVLLRIEAGLYGVGGLDVYENIFDTSFVKSKVGFSEFEVVLRKELIRFVDWRIERRRKGGGGPVDVDAGVGGFWLAGYKGRRGCRCGGMAEKGGGCREEEGLSVKDLNALELGGGTEAAESECVHFIKRT